MEQMIGTFVPVLGLVATFVIAFVVTRPGATRYVVLLAGPALTLAVSILIAEAVSRNGNILFVLLLVGLIIFVVVYYPVLLAVWLYLTITSRRVE